MAKNLENKEKTVADQSLSKTLTLLTKLATTSETLSVSEIAEEIKVSKPTAYAMVNALSAQGYIEKDENGKYHVGYMFYALGQNYPRLYPFLSFMESAVLEAHERLGLRINVCVFKPPLTALVIASKDNSLVPRHSGGFMLPAHLSASGKVLLAALPTETVEKYVDESELYSLTDKTITDKETLLAHVEQARTLGYATDEEEFVPGSACIAVPVYDAAGRLLCSVSLSRCPIARFNRERDKLIGEAKNLSRRISYEMGLSREMGAKLYK